MKKWLVVLFGVIGLLFLLGCSNGGLSLGAKDCGNNKECFDDALRSCSPAVWYPEEGIKALDSGHLDLYSDVNSKLTIEGMKGDDCKLVVENVWDGRPDSSYPKKIKRDYCYRFYGEQYKGVYWNCDTIKP